jgi:hypothetical protein
MNLNLYSIKKYSLKDVRKYHDKVFVKSTHSRMVAPNERERECEREKRVLKLHRLTVTFCDLAADTFSQSPHFYANVDIRFDLFRSEIWAA